jgi:hypothetical protein
MVSGKFFVTERKQLILTLDAYTQGIVQKFHVYSNKKQQHSAAVFHP